MNLNDAINVIESASGFTDETTSVGEAWAIVLASLNPALAPVPVSERPWEREGWCDEEGRCWWGRQETDDWYADWTLSTYEDTQEFCTYNPMTVCLPATALPLPAGEVE